MKYLSLLLTVCVFFSCRKSSNEDTCMHCHTDVWQKDGSSYYVKYTLDTSICAGDKDSLAQNYKKRYSGYGPHGNYMLNQDFVTTCK